MQNKAIQGARGQTKGARSSNYTKGKYTYKHMYKIPGLNNMWVLLID